LLYDNGDFLAGMAGISTTLSGDEGVGGVASMAAGRRRQWRKGWRGERDRRGVV
jgi:hypothetical protein